MKKDLNSIFNLKGKVIVITGGAGMLGLKHAEAIAAYDGKPILIDNNKNKLEESINYLNKLYKVKSEGYLVDITNENEVKTNCDQIIKRFGKINALINNASVNLTDYLRSTDNLSDTSSMRLENYSIDVWNRDIEVGLTGAFLCSKYYGSKIILNSEGGTIINISSDLALIAPDQRLYKKDGLDESKQPVKPISYVIVKSALIGLTRYLSTYWPEHNVRCNAICPGGINDNFNDNFIKNISSRIPLGRMATKDEYQGTIIWMLSDAASYLNGSVIAIDGGRTVW